MKNSNYFAIITLLVCVATRVGLFFPLSFSVCFDYSVGFQLGF